MKIFNILIIVLLMTQTASAETIKDVPGTRSLSDKIVHLFLKEKFDKGMTLSKQYWSMPSFELDRLASQLNSQWPPMKKNYGEPVGMEFVKATKINDTFVKYYYLHKFQNHAIYWMITFYKPAKAWKLNGITFKSDTSILFETEK